MSKTIAVRANYVVIWKGPGWYADLGRHMGQSYVEGAQIASVDEFGKDGVMTSEFEKEMNEGRDPNSDDYQSPSIWDWAQGRGTPYWLNEKPEEEK